MDIIELHPTDGRKSFYGKAIVINEDGKLKCRSYQTIVAEYEKDTDTLQINGWYSTTTARHINAFCDYVGKKRVSKEDMELCISY